MPIYCDESGGLSAGAMTFAAVLIDGDAADALLARFRAITGLRGEMKGSRISLIERGLFFELLERFKGRAIIGEILRDRVPPEARQEKDLDLKTYTALLETVVQAWLPEVDGCAEVIIDDGRYDAGRLSLVRQDIAALLGTCGRARLEDSKRSAGVQIADVIANSMFNLAVGSPRTDRIRRIAAPFLDSAVLRIRPL